MDPTFVPQAVPIGSHAASLAISPRLSAREDRRQVCTVLPDFGIAAIIWTVLSFIKEKKLTHPDAYNC